MIEQYTITTTPKYNFPQPIMDTKLPQHFLELSLHSLKHLQSQTFQLNQESFQQTNVLETGLQTLQLKPQPVSLKPSLEETIVAAVDTSTMKVGETKAGIVIAVRGANVWKQGGHYRYMRLGPFIFHLTEENKREIYGTLEKAYFGFADGYNHHGTLSLLQMPIRIANLLERWLQTMLSKTMANGLILFDGSLTSGTPDDRTHRMKEILGSARKRGNVVLAFSKMTTLRVNGHIMTDFLPTHRPPCLFETVNLKLKPPTVLLGDVYVAKLSRESYAFRLDIDREISHEMRVKAVERLLGNDLLSQSYPETLRLAHILCTFTANEVLAMQHLIARRYGLQIVTRLDIHRLLFGPFGKGENYS